MNHIEQNFQKFIPFDYSTGDTVHKQPQPFGNQELQKLDSWKRQELGSLLINVVPNTPTSTLLTLLPDRGVFIRQADIIDQFRRYNDTPGEYTYAAFVHHFKGL